MSSAFMEMSKVIANDFIQSILFVDDKDKCKAAIAWSNTKVVMVDDADEKEERALEDGDASAEWRYLWSFCRYDQTQYVNMSGLNQGEAAKHLNHLKALRLIYPDGTVNLIARTIIGGLIRQSISKVTGQRMKNRDEGKTRTTGKNTT